MTRRYLRYNQFGFIEYEDMIQLSREIDVAELVDNLDSIVKLVLSGEVPLLDSLTDEAQGNFVVPLGMCGKMLSDGTFSEMELVSAACMVRQCAEPHFSEFPCTLTKILLKLPR